MNDSAAAGNIDVKTAPDIIQSCRDRCGPSAPDRQIVSLDFGHIGAGAVDDHASTVARLDRRNDPTAETGVFGRVPRWMAPLPPQNKDVREVRLLVVALNIIAEVLGHQRSKVA